MNTQNFTIRDHDGTQWNEKHPKTNMDQVIGLNDKLGEIEAVAKGASAGYTFDTVAQLDAWLAVAANKAKLEAGDNLYIRDTGVPDYWWDGTQKQELETQKVVLSNATTTADGLMSKTDKVKLNGIAEGATKVTAPSDIGAATAAQGAKADSALQSVPDASTTVKGVATLGASGGAARHGQKADVGLANVDNTSDANKPVSTAQQTALNNKLDKSAQAADSAKLGGKAASDYATAAQGAKADTALQSVPFESTAGNIKMNGVAAAGASGKVADAAHVHPTDTSRASVSHAHGAADLTVSVVTVGPTAPVNPKLGDVWFDTSGN